jgi:hypothetical protein
LKLSTQSKLGKQTSAIMSAVAVIKPVTKAVTKDVYDTVKESLLKDVKDADWKTVRNYSLLAIGFSLSGYLMYRNRSSVYSSIELMVYTKEERINRRMNEWLTSKKVVDNHRRFSSSLIAEMSKESGLSEDCSVNLRVFLESYKQYFGPEISIFDICKCVVNIKDYSLHNWLLLATMCNITGISNIPVIITDPILFSAMDVIHKLLKELPVDTSDQVIHCITIVFSSLYSRVNLGASTTLYRLFLPPIVWDRIDQYFKSNSHLDKVREFYHILQPQNTL